MSEVLGAEFNERAKRTLQAMADVVLEEVAKPQCVFCRRGGKAVPGEVAPHLGSLVHHEVGPMTYVCSAQEIHRLKGGGGE